MKIDKQNGNVAFSESTHNYFDVTDPSKKYISVTTLIHKFEPPFDKNFWSAYKAAEQLVDPDYWKTAKKELLNTKTCDKKFLDSYNVPIADFNAVQQGILDAWQRDSLSSTQRGTEIHAALEHSFYAQGSDISLQKYGVGGKFICVEGKTDLDLENGIYPEYLIYYESPDRKLNLAGQIDLLVKEGDSFSIIDWKGLPLDTKLPTLKGWTTMGNVAVGDKLFDRDGRPCSVVAKSEIHKNPCLKITFSNGDSIVADEEHRWLVSELSDIQNTEKVLTTKEIQKCIDDTKLVIVNTEPLECDFIKLSLDAPQTDGGWLDLINSVLRAAYEQRQVVANMVCHTCVKADHAHDCFKAIPKPYTKAFRELLISLGYQTVMTPDGGFLFGNGGLPYTTIIDNMISKNPKYRTIEKVEPVETVLTQCIEVDSPSKTYLCTENMIITHNTNKQIKRNSYYNQATKKSEKLNYPLNELDNCNYSVYNMQLSTYAWMIQQQHPEWKCNDLVLVHFDHNNNMTTYKMDYLKEQVEKMVNFWKKQSVLEFHREQWKRIEY